MASIKRHLMDMNREIQLRKDALKIKRDNDMRSFDLSGIQAQIFPSLGKFRHLHTLNLSNNNLTSLEFLSENTMLKELDVSQNNLATISNQLHKMPCLEKLFLESNILRDVCHICSELRKCITLRVLSLLSNPVAQEPCYRRKLITSLTSLISLDREDIQDKERLAYLKPKTTNVGFGKHLEKAGMEADTEPYTCPKPTVVTPIFKQPRLLDDWQIDSAVKKRIDKHSKWVYQTVDWSTKHEALEASKCLYPIVKRSEPDPSVVLKEKVEPDSLFVDERISLPDRVMFTIR